MILVLTNNADFTQTIDKQYRGKDSFHLIQACTGLFYTSLPCAGVFTCSYTLNTGHFHTPEKHAHNLKISWNISVFKKPNISQKFIKHSINWKS